MDGNSIKASGRSSSQRSIHEYPEHLNPFYEDENHKRLRFWKIGKDKSNRSNSFSIDGLKGLWSFKTFKLKKKSSTLGINKTSESPPMLRREDDRYGSQSTIDGCIRHTVDIGLSNNFQRGAPSRSSLQDLNSVSRHRAESFFIRNNRYRSTVQPGHSGFPQSNRYQSNPTIGPATPLFRSKYNRRGSSQLSVNSNPFDDEYETISEVTSPERTSIRHSSRKKRRAPQPPISPHKTVATVEQSGAEIVEPDKTVNITNLTAEIESFVRTADTDEEVIESKTIQPSENGIKENGFKFTECEKEEHKKVRTPRQSPESNNFYPENVHLEELSIEKIENLGETDFNSNERCKRSPIKIFVRAPTDEEPISLVDDEPTLRAEAIESDYEAKDNVCEENTLENDAEDFRCEQIGEVNLDIKEKEEGHLGENEMCEKFNEVCEVELTTPTSSAVEFILENDIKRDDLFSATELKITESSDDLTNIVPNSFAQTSTSNGYSFENDEINIKKTESVDKFEVRSIPLKLESPKLRKKPVEVGNAKKEPPTPPQRRRSVKEIIESINKCQSLLKVNQDLNTNKAEKDKMNSNLYQASTSSKSSNNKNLFFDRNLHDRSEKGFHHKRMFSDIAEVNNNAKVEDMADIPLFVEKFNEFNNNHSDALFEKCVVQNDKKISGEQVEWNPVPKPRRRKCSPNGIFDS